MRQKLWAVGALAGFALAGAANTLAQDSVSKNASGGLPGDAVPAYDGSEQCNNYVVDLDEFLTSWNNTFAIAPIIKSSKTSTTFYGSLLSAQALSRTMHVGTPLSGSYGLWTVPGQGVNDDSAINDPPGSTIALSGNGVKFSAAVSEFSTADGGASYNAIVGANISIKPDAPKRLYVSRVNAALNGCNGTANTSQVALGSVDLDGNIHFRADGVGSAAAACSTPLAALVENNIFRVKIGDQNCGNLNVVSNDFPGGLFDAPATDWLVRNQPSATNLNHNPPGIVPTLPPATEPLMITTDFSARYARGTAFGGIVSDNTHLTAGLPDHRGNISWTPNACAALGTVMNPPTRGAAAVIGRDAAGVSDEMVVFGLDNNGDVTGKRALTLPAVITDPTTGATNLAGANEINHYHSQVAFRGGNGQIALGTDQNGNLLAAVEVDHPNYSTNDWPLNYIAVAKLNCSTGVINWVLAGYTDGATGKPILDGPGGTQIGQMTTLNNVTGGAPFGPSVSAPMIDSVGNVWFLTAMELFGEPDPFDTGLVRAVYNPATFRYELELILRTGDIFHGQNSDRDYLITFLEIADSNSVSSGTAWSQNISSRAYLGQSTTGLNPADPKTLGGLVLAAGMIYDRNNDSTFEGCTGGVCPPNDEEYNVLLYIGSTATAGIPCTTALDCREANAPADNNGCNCAACVSNSCVFNCVVYGNTNCAGPANPNLDDILCVLAGFSSFASCPNGDIAPCGGNNIINLDDILAVLGAFSGGNPCGCAGVAGTPPLCGGP